MTWLKRLVGGRAKPDSKGEGGVGQQSHMNPENTFGVGRELGTTVALYRCKCSKVLKVFAFPSGQQLVCPNCTRSFQKPAQGKHTETFAGLMTVSLIRAHVFASRGNEHPGSVCDYCLSPTQVHDGYVASRGIMLLSDIKELIPFYPKPVPQEAISGMIDLLRSQIQNDQSPWLLCERCAGIAFRTALDRILKTGECPTIWDCNQYDEDVSDFLGDYEKHFDVIGKNEDN